jgi:hypothetical protein
MFNDLEMYLYRNHTFVVGGSGRVFIHAGQTIDAPLVAEAVNLDAATLAVDAIKAGQDGMPAFSLLVALGLLAQAGTSHTGNATSH